MTYLLSKNDKIETLKNLPNGTKYYMCLIKGYWLSYERELWGYVITSNGFEDAEELFTKEYDEYLGDSPLDYGFMVIYEYAKGLNNRKPLEAKINNFGKWIDLKDFLEENYSERGA